MVPEPCTSHHSLIYTSYTRFTSSGAQTIMSIYCSRGKKTNQIKTLLIYTSSESAAHVCLFPNVTLDRRPAYHSVHPCMCHWMSASGRSGPRQDGKEATLRCPCRRPGAPSAPGPLEHSPQAASEAPALRRTQRTLGRTADP